VQVFAKYEVQETITDREKVMEVRQVGARQLQQILQSGKVRASGVFADARGLLCSGGRFGGGALRYVLPGTRLHPHRDPSADNGGEAGRVLRKGRDCHCWLNPAA
jgi:hypothetical protein